MRNQIKASQHQSHGGALECLGGGSPSGEVAPPVRSVIVTHNRPVPPVSAYAAPATEGCLVAEQALVLGHSSLEPCDAAAIRPGGRAGSRAVAVGGGRGRWRSIGACTTVLGCSEWRFMGVVVTSINSQSPSVMIPDLQGPPQLRRRVLIYCSESLMFDHF